MSNVYENKETNAHYLWAKKLEIENVILNEEVSMLKLRIKKLEEVNLPLVLHCDCKKRTK